MKIDLKNDHTSTESCQRAQEKYPRSDSHSQLFTAVNTESRMTEFDEHIQGDKNDSKKNESNSNN